VLPFVNMSGGPEQEYFSNGMTEDLITDLSKLSGLFVTARNSSFYYKGKAVKVEQVSKELGVQYMVEGSVRKADNRVRITTQLVDATTGHHLWAERYDRELKDIFALQDEIRRKIVVHLGLRLIEEERERADRDYNLEAYDSYLRGAEYFGRWTKKANVQARQMFEKAITLDPSYAEAYVMLGATYHIEWTEQWSDDPQSLERASALAQKAVALDNSLPYAHVILSIVHLLKGQYEQAIAEAEWTITLAPNYANAYALVGAILNSVGRPEEAIGMAEKAMRLDPRYLFFHLPVLGQAYLLTGRYEEAVDVLKRAVTLNLNYLPIHTLLAVVYNELDREAEARAEAAAVLRLNPNYSLEIHRQRAPLKDPAVLERSLAALHKAGLK